MHKSKKILYWMFKYGILLIGVLGCLNLVFVIINPESTIEVNGVEKRPDIYDSVILLSFPLLFLLLGMLCYRKVVRVEMSHSGISITDGNETFEKKWIEVKRLNLFRLVYPPFYSIAFEGESESYWFATNNSFISFPLFTIDLSEMGTFLKRKKKEFRL